MASNPSNLAATSASTLAEKDKMQMSSQSDAQAAMGEVSFLSDEEDKDSATDNGLVK